jgi:hypothetical protein
MESTSTHAWITLATQWNPPQARLNHFKLLLKSNFTSQHPNKRNQDNSALHSFLVLQLADRANTHFLLQLILRGSLHSQLLGYDKNFELAFNIDNWCEKYPPKTSNGRRNNQSIPRM